MLKRRFHKIVFLFIALLVFPVLSRAAPAEQMYQVELIIFLQPDNGALQSEFWSRQPILTIPSNATEISKADLIPQSQWQLASLQSSLKKNGYTILLHTAWLTSATESRKGEIIHLQGGEQGSPFINGVLGLRLEHYFNIRLNLQYALPWQMINNLDLPNIQHDTDDTYATFNLTQDLRMRSDELNYIDHPLFGVLIKITQGN